MRHRSCRPAVLARIAGVVAIAAVSVSACASDSPAISSATVDASVTTTTCVDSVMQPCDMRGDDDGDGRHGDRGGPGDVDPAAMQAAVDSFTACLRDEGLDVDDLDMGSMPDRDHDGPPPSDGSTPDDGPHGDDPASRVVTDLGLDTGDATVMAAVEACTPVLMSAFPPPPDGGNTDTTAGA